MNMSFWSSLKCLQIFFANTINQWRHINQESLCLKLNHQPTKTFSRLVIWFGNFLANLPQVRANNFVRCLWRNCKQLLGITTRVFYPFTLCVPFQGKKTTLLVRGGGHIVPPLVNAVLMAQTSWNFVCDLTWVVSERFHDQKGTIMCQAPGWVQDPKIQKCQSAPPH